MVDGGNVDDRAAHRGPGRRGSGIEGRRLVEDSASRRASFRRSSRLCPGRWRRRPSRSGSRRHPHR